MGTYYGNLATKLVFDLARLNGIWGVFCDELRKVFDTHVCDSWL
jgi:hypothetical protein